MDINDDHRRQLLLGIVLISILIRSRFSLPGRKYNLVARRQRIAISETLTANTFFVISIDFGDLATLK